LQILRSRSVHHCLRAALILANSPTTPIHRHGGSLSPRQVFRLAVTGRILVRPALTSLSCHDILSVQMNIY
jgi:hypothetical protein